MERQYFARGKEFISNLLSKGKDPAHCPWSILDVIGITVLMALFMFNDPLHLGFYTVRFLRAHFFIFTKEPKLLYYLTIYINTIIFKLISLIFVTAAIKLRKIPFWSSVVFSGKIPSSWGAWLPIYIIVCVVFRFLSISNPLVPNIPFNSVYIEAFLVGNVVVVFSILVIAPFIEEILFRGFLYPACNKYMGMYPSILLTSVLFTLAHYPQIRESYVFAAIIFTLGVIITYARAKTGSTWLAIIMHHIYNLVYVILGIINYLFVKY
jgi:membrane protease YdiL (CAAX protease family)